MGNRKPWKSSEADYAIKHCKTCKNCWESVRLTPYGLNYSKKYLMKYEDFPSYGKAKETCPSCLGNASHKMIVCGMTVQEVIKS